MWTEITNICRLRSQNCQNATSLKVAGIKQACSQVFRFGGQNKLLRGKNFCFMIYVLRAMHKCKVNLNESSAEV